MAMRPLTKPITKADPDFAEEFFTQRKRAESRQFRLQVDRQTKASYETYEEAEQAGLAIKRGYPILQVGVYDAVQGINKIIELLPV